MTARRESSTSTGALTGQRVLVTGVAGPLEGRLALRLEADERVEAIVGVDLREPPSPLQRLEFIRTDLSNPLLGQVIEETGVDTIVHLELERAGAVRALLAAGQRASRVNRLVVRSTTAVYGSSATDPALQSEDAPADGGGRSPWGSRAADAEAAIRAFGRRRADAAVVILRMASLLAPGLDTSLARYLRLPVVPTPLGYDPRLQLCHADDAVAVAAHAALGGQPGIYNVGGRGVLYLSQAVRLVGRPAVPVPAPVLRRLLGLLRCGETIDDACDDSLLTFGRVGDLRRIGENYGAPLRSTRAALLDWLEGESAAAEGKGRR